VVTHSPYIRTNGNCSIVFGRAARATARNRAMVTVMAVALEEEGNGEGGKSNGDGNKYGDGKQRR
jgi:hypothetical protein